MATSNNKPIVVALASFGMSGEVFHAPIITSNPYFFLKTILERSSDRCLATYPWVKVVKTFDELLEDSEIELIVVNTPNEHHFPMTKQALLAGKNVVIEKPFTISVSEGEELIQLAKDLGLTISVFHSKRFESDFLTVKKLLHSNVIGSPVELHWHYDRYRTHITHKRWKEDDLPGAGVLYDLGVHLIDSVVQLFGSPKTVTAHLRTLRDGAGSPDYFHVRLGYEDTDIYLHASTMVCEKVATITLHGTKGSYVKYGNDPQEEQAKAGLKPGDTDWGLENENQYGILHTEIENEIQRKPLKSERGCYEQYYQGIYSAIREGELPPVSGEQAVHNIRIIHYVIQSHREQRTIML